MSAKRSSEDFKDNYIPPKRPHSEFESSQNNNEKDEITPRMEKELRRCMLDAERIKIDRETYDEIIENIDKYEKNRIYYREKVREIIQIQNSIMKLFKVIGDKNSVFPAQNITGNYREVDESIYNILRNYFKIPRRYPRTVLEEYLSIRDLIQKTEKYGVYRVSRIRFPHPDLRLSNILTSHCIRYQYDRETDIYTLYKC